MVARINATAKFPRHYNTTKKRWHITRLNLPMPKEFSRIKTG